MHGICYQSPIYPCRLGPMIGDGERIRQSVADRHPSFPYHATRDYSRKALFEWKIDGQFRCRAVFAWIAAEKSEFLRRDFSKPKIYMLSLICVNNNLQLIVYMTLILRPWSSMLGLRASKLRLIASIWGNVKPMSLDTSVVCRGGTGRGNRGGISGYNLENT